MSLAIAVSGHSITTTPQDYVIPKIFFWSQDTSTKFPALTNFDGFELGAQKRITETKLLGQDYIYLKNNQMALTSELVSRPDLWRFGTSDTRTITPKGLFSRHLLENKGLLRESVKDKSAKPNSRNLQSKPHQREEPNVPKLIKHEYSSEQIANAISAQRVNAVNLPGITTNQLSAKVHVIRGPWSGDPKGTISLRRPRKKNEEMLRTFKTRADAKKIYREMLVRTPCSKFCNSPGNVVELERSYTDLPMFLEEIRRLKRDIEKDPTIDGKQYSKSTFCHNLQRQISSRNLNRTRLPIPFRKPTNTNLKHYRYSYMGFHTEPNKKSLSMLSIAVK